MRNGLAGVSSTQHTEKKTWNKKCVLCISKIEAIIKIEYLPITTI